MNWTKYKLLLFVVLVISLPWSMLVTNIATILLTLVTITEGDLKVKFRSLRQNKPLLLLATFYLLHIISLFYSTDKSAALFDLEKKLSLLLFPFIFSGYKYQHRKNATELISKAFIGSVTIACLYCLGYAFYRNYTIGDPASLPYSFSENFNLKNTFGLYWDYFSYSELAKPLGLHPTYFSLFTVFAAFIAIYTLLYKDKSNKRLVACYISAIAILLLFTLLLSSRIVILGFMLSLAVFFILHIWRYGILKKQILFLPACVVLVLALLFALPVTRYRVVTETAQVFGNSPQATETGVSQRTLVWNTATDVAKDNLISGTGIGDVQQILNERYTDHNNPELVGLNAHNQYLQTLIGTGVAGLLLLLLLLLYPLFVSLVRQDILRTIFLILIISACVTEAILQSNKGIVFYSFFYSYLFSRHIPYKASSIEA